MGSTTAGLGWDEELPSGLLDDRLEYRKDLKPLNNFRLPGWMKCNGTDRQASPIVTVKQGKLKGSVKTLLDGKPYYSFKGIRYGQPPVGKLRFKAPSPVKPWDGILEVIEHGSICPQFDMMEGLLKEGNEDCLFLNVYTKSLEPSSKTPVLVYIHGGAFMSGSGNSDTYGPEFFFLHDVILVTINYRLEALGFLCLDTPEVPGNAAMKDQVLALRWVKENIDRFGGDPENITIFGESAGAALVTFHIISDMSRGLFHKAIVQSGVALADWALGLGSVDKAFTLGKVLGKETNNVDELLEFLQNVPAIDLAGVTLKTRIPDESFRGLPIYFAPVIEKKMYGVEHFLTEEPVDLLLEGKVNKMPVLIGYNSAEGILMTPDTLKKKKIFNEKPSFLVPRQAKLRVSEEKLKEFGDRIKTFYVGKKDFEVETTDSIVNLRTDLHFSYETHRFINFYHKYAPVFLYKFDFDTDFNIPKSLVGLNVKGASHADDLFYLFYNMMNKDYYHEQDKLQKIVYQLTKFWTEFARNGNPSAGGLKWPPYTPLGGEYMLLNEELSVARHADRDRVDFWNQLYRDAGLPSVLKSSI